MLNLIRRILRPTLRQQLEEGVREALRRYADRRTVPDLHVYLSTDLVPEGVDPALWAEDEGDHLRAFADQWAQDNGIPRAGLALDVVLLDTKRDFAFVKAAGAPPEPEPAERLVERPAPAPAQPPPPTAAPRLEVVESPSLRTAISVSGSVTLGRKGDGEVVGTDDRYMSARHARFSSQGGRLEVVDLDSKNRTYVNDVPLEPHRPHPLSEGDVVRMGGTVLRATGLSR
jgi:hypothetical protein